jgi:hypothetical protein
MNCGSNDPLFPMQADIFYPKVDQGAYGNVSKSWTLDRTLVCSLGPAGSRFSEEVIPNVDLSLESTLIGRFKEDIRMSSDDRGKSIVNIVVSNIKDRNCNEVYIETAGPRINKSTIFEVATVTPHIGPFGGVEYYRVILKRSENQGVDV